MYHPNHPTSISMMIGAIGDLYMSLNGTRVQGCPVTPDGTDENGKTVRQHLEGLQAAIDRFLAGEKV